jgi:hypothetical protein
MLGCFSSLVEDEMCVCVFSLLSLLFLPVAKACFVDHRKDERNGRVERGEDRGRRREIIVVQT